MTLAFSSRLCPSIASQSQKHSCRLVLIIQASRPVSLAEGIGFHFGAGAGSVVVTICVNKQLGNKRFALSVIQDLY